MSDLTEEFLNEDDGDFPDVAEADEEALLQDDEDVLNLVPEEDLSESLDDSRINVTEQEHNRTDRQKFATEREKISAPDLTFSNQQGDKPKQFRRQNVRRNGRGGLFSPGRKFFNRNNPSGKNKTVLINPRFQGIVHVNNNARLAWDNTQGMPQQQFPVNPWNSGAMGQPTQPPPPMQIPSMQNFPEPIPNMQVPGPPMHFTPPQQQVFMPQQMPQGIPQQAPMQHMQQQPYWDGINNQYSTVQAPNQWSFQVQGPPPESYMQNNFQQPPPIIINTGNPPPQFPPPDMYQQTQRQPPSQPLHFIPPRLNFQKNNMNVNHSRHFNQGYNEKKVKRKGFVGSFGQNPKKVHERLGLVKKSQVKVKIGKIEERVPVVTEVRVTDVTTVKIEEDEQTQDLRLKIEEQKRKREAILKWKEERRLQSLQDAVEENKPEPLTLQQEILPKQEQKVSQQVLNQSQQFKMKKHANNIVVTNGYSKKVTKYQKNVKNFSVPVISKIAEESLDVRNIKQEPDLELDSKHLSSFLADRKILAKDETLMPTRKVVIKNISTSTGDKKIFEICTNIGEVQNLQRDINERQATITFKSVASAHNFFKKYQRHMLDLSMIEVSLSPMKESD